MPQSNAPAGDDLAQQVAALRAEVAQLRTDVEQLRGERGVAPD
jgi:outer membrane murein-binding lipoprotein Lpp